MLRPYNGNLCFGTSLVALGSLSLQEFFYAGDVLGDVDADGVVLDFAGTDSASPQSPERLNLAVKGTNFQLKVWRALVEVGSGGPTTYQTVAHAAGVKCSGANACKGQSACKGASSACKGQNTCKGQGWSEAASAADCTANGGKVL